MSDFQFDTSGRVECNNTSKPCICHTATWDRLSPFAQGYVRAAFEANSVEFKDDDGDWVLSEGHPFHNGRPLAFSDLAPEALAAMLRDCGAFRAIRGKVEDVYSHDNVVSGRTFHFLRQRGDLADFPPLAPYLGDDGKVRGMGEGQ